MWRTLRSWLVMGPLGFTRADHLPAYVPDYEQ